MFPPISIFFLLLFTAIENSCELFQARPELSCLLAWALPCLRTFWVKGHTQIKMGFIVLNLFWQLVTCTVCRVILKYNADCNGWAYSSKLAGPGFVYCVSDLSLGRYSMLIFHLPNLYSYNSQEKEFSGMKSGLSHPLQVTSR